MELDYLPKPEPPRRNPVPPAPSRHGGAGGRETPMKGRDARVASREGRRGKEGRGGRVGGWKGRRGAREEEWGVTLGLGGLDLGVFQSSGGGEGAVGGLEWTAVEETVRERVEWEAVKGAVKPLPGRGGGEAALPGLQKLRWELSPWEIEMGFGLGPAQVAGTEQWGMGGSDVADEEAPPSLPGRWEKSQTPTAAPPLHKVGICVVPPVQTWPAIQEVRRQHDRHFERWPPHINLVYPLLLTDQELRDLPANLKTLLRDVPPFTVEMKSFRFFRHPLSCMLWAHPEKGGAELRRLQALIAAAYPPEAPSGTLGATSGGGVATVAGFGPEGVGGEGREGVEGEGGWVEGGFKDEGPGAGQYIPHLCLGQWKDEEEMRWAREELAARWPALRWEVQAVHLVSSVDRLAAPVQAARSQQLINASNVLPLRGSRGAEWPEPPPPRPAPFPASTPTPPPVAHEKAAGAQGGAGPTVGSDGTERVAGRAVDAAPGVWSLAAAQQGRGLLKWQRGGLYPEAEAARYREEQTRRIKGISLEREDGGARSARDVSEEGPPPDSGPWRGGRWRGRQWPLEPLEAAGAESGGGSTRTLMRALRVPSVPITEEEEDEEGVGEGDEEEGSAGAGSDGDIQGMGYEDVYVANKARGGTARRAAAPEALQAPALTGKGGARFRPTIFADLTEESELLTEIPRRAWERKPPLELLLLRHATASLHGMKSRLQPLAAKIISSGTGSEQDKLARLISNRRVAVARREAALASKTVFSRKVAKELGGLKGEVTLRQLREWRWREAIVEAQREFRVNSLRLEAFQSRDQQARSWCTSLARDVVQTLTLMDRREVQALVANRDQWARVKDVLQAQGNLRLEYSVVWLLEQADLEASSDLALEYVMAVTDFADRKGAGWDNHLNAARPRGQATFRFVKGVPGHYVYYDMYGWC